MKKIQAKVDAPFETIITQTPDDLKGEPYNIYSSDIAISLYSVKEYKQVSLRQILKNIGNKLIDDTDIKAKIASSIIHTIRYLRLP